MTHTRQIAKQLTAGSVLVEECTVPQYLTLTAYRRERPSRRPRRWRRGR